MTKKKEPTDEELIREWNRLNEEYQQGSVYWRTRSWANSPGRRRYVENRMRSIRREAIKRKIDFL